MTAQAQGPIRHIEFNSKVRILGPQAEHNDLQSVYIFNMYRAGSSVTEAVAQSLAFGSKYTSWNLVSELDTAGVGLIDHRDYSRHSVFVDDNAMALDRIGQLGGYLYYGFREIPHGYAERFLYNGASVIVARDPRDIGISQFSAVKKHVISGAAGHDIERLREMTENLDLESFLLSDNTLNFLRRITRCYRPLLQHGCTLLHYETFMTPSGLDLHNFLKAVAESLSPYLELERPIADILRNLDARVANSRGLKGHATGGKVNIYKSLPPDTLKKLNAALEPELRLFGYL